MDFDFKTIGILLGGIASGIGGLKIFEYLLGTKKENRSDFESIIDVLNEDNKRLRAEQQEMSRELKEVVAAQARDREEFHKMSMKLQLMESAHYDLPVPAWLKDTNGVMLAINPAYEELFLTPLGLNPSDYIGKTDVEFWGETIGRPYMVKDQQVFRNGKSELCIETVPLPNKETTRYLILKYVRTAGNVKIGIAGMAFKEMKPNETI